MSTDDDLGTAIAQLDRSSLRDQARRALRTSIVTGELEAGRLFAVGTFAERLGVSATPVREALSDLANEGLVQVMPNRGFVVPALTEHDLDEIFELRLMLEVPAVARVAGKLTTGDVHACRLQVERGAYAADAADLLTFLEADREFHHRLLLTLGNARLLQTIDRLRDQARLYGLVDLASQGVLVSAADEHAQLLAVVEAGDRRGAAAQMTLHLKHTRGAWAGRAEAPSDA